MVIRLGASVLRLARLTVFGRVPVLGRPGVAQRIERTRLLFGSCTFDSCPLTRSGTAWGLVSVAPEIGPFDFLLSSCPRFPGFVSRFHREYRYVLSHFLGHCKRTCGTLPTKPLNRLKFRNKRSCGQIGRSRSRPVCSSDPQPICLFRYIIAHP